jgi:predicted nucleic acid-binding protein
LEGSVICVDSTFLIDLLRADAAATVRAKELSTAESTIATPAVCMAEVLRRAYLIGGVSLARAQNLFAQVEILPIDAPVADRAAELNAECLKRGREVPLIDCLIAAAAISARAVLLTRDSDFSRIPSLQTETY